MQPSIRRVNIAFSDESRNIGQVRSPAFEQHSLLRIWDPMFVDESSESDSPLRAADLLLAAQARSNCSLRPLLQGYRDYLHLLAGEQLGSNIKVKASASDLVQKSLPEHGKSASSILMKHELLDALQVTLRKLPGRYQEVIQWRNYDRASFEEI